MSKSNSKSIYKYNKRSDIDYIYIYNSFNQICGKKISIITKMTDYRKSLVRKANPSVLEFGGWDKLWKTVAASDFLTTPNEKWNGADFDWILNPKHLQQIIEGKYKNRQTEVKPNGQSDESSKWFSEKDIDELPF